LLNSEVEAGIEGSTDSEYVFGLIRHLGSGDNTLEDALQAAFAQLRGWHDDSRADALLNIVVTDGSQLLAARHALAARCPSLYSCTAHPDFPDAVLLASEPFDRRGDWQEVPAHHFVSLMPGHRCRTWAI
jgi:glutamine amidotransferase